MPALTNTLTDIPGILVGHAQDMEALTGCTVILCKRGATAGVDQRGGAPGTRETDALRPMHMVQKAHAIVLAGGSAFGLDAASGVMRYLNEQKVGFNTGVARVPIVASAILFDLALGNNEVRPTAEMGYQACLAASSPNVQQGNVGAGAGASVGKIFGMGQAMKSGIGTASLDVGGGVIVAAIIAVNAFGDVVDQHSGEILAGARTVQTGPVTLGATPTFADTLETMKTLAGRTILHFASLQNTVIGVVATNARLNKEEINKVAQMAHNGLALTIRPAHTMLDGDTIFSLATGQRAADVNIVGAFAAQAVAAAVMNAVLAAEPAGGLPAHNSILQKAG
ncbi:MAG TPA: P1 family peptidase [Anaerolineaceae bacterium]